MTDTFERHKRSEIMSKIHSKNTGPEIALRKALYHEGLRGYRIFYKLPGRPDIAYTRAKVVIFVDGCFWHGCPICNKSFPKDNEVFWRNKIIKNMERDHKVDKELMEFGWTILRFWEHEIQKHLDDCVLCIKKIVKNI